MQRMIMRMLWPLAAGFIAKFIAKRTAGSDGPDGAPQDRHAAKDKERKLRRSMNMFRRISRF